MRKAVNQPQEADAEEHVPTSKKLEALNHHLIATLTSC
jgi:hypothetical protein